MARCKQTHRITITETLPDGRVVTSYKLVPKAEHFNQCRRLKESNAIEQVKEANKHYIARQGCSRIEQVREAHEKRRAKQVIKENERRKASQERKHMEDEIKKLKSENQILRDRLIRCDVDTSTSYGSGEFMRIRTNEWNELLSRVVALETRNHVKKERDN
jgi:hypothetical protein